MTIATIATPLVDSTNLRQNADPSKSATTTRATTPAWETVAGADGILVTVVAPIEAITPVGLNATVGVRRLAPHSCPRQ